MSDLDEQELKATREIKELNKIIAPEEKSADEMFEELGYEKFDNHPPEEKIEPNMWTTQDCRIIEYSQKATIKGVFYTLFIRFHIEGQRVEVGASERREGYREMCRYRNPILNAQELKAINKKCKELRLDK